MRIAVFFSLVLATASLAGCSGLNSAMPLIARSDPAAHLPTGEYRAFQLTEPDRLQDLSARGRAACFSPGYARPDRHGALRYCPLEGDGHVFPRFRVEHAGDDYRLVNLDGADRYVLRFERLTDTVWILQFSPDMAADRDAAMPGGEVGAVYSLVRQTGSDIEVLDVPCDSGVEEVSTEVASSEPGQPAQPSEPKPPRAPPPALKCAITSLAAVRPDMLARAGNPGATPDMILKRMRD